MADDEQVVDQEVDTDNPDGDTDDDNQVSPEYKQLQRTFQKKLDTERAKNRGLMNQLLEQRGISADISRLDTGIERLMELVGADEEDDGPAKEFRENRETTKALKDAAQKLTKLFSDHDTDWSDERLNAASELWNQGLTKEAFAVAETALTSDAPGAKSEEVSALVAAEVQKVLKAGGRVVDGNPAGSGGRRRPLTKGELTQWLRTQTRRQRS